MAHGKRLDVLDSGRDEFGARERAGNRPMAGPAGHARRCVGRAKGDAAYACLRGATDEPRGRTRAPGEGPVAPLQKLAEHVALPAPLERRVREAGPAGGWFGGSYISHNWLRASRGIT